MDFFHSNESMCVLTFRITWLLPNEQLCLEKEIHCHRSIVVMIKDTLNKIHKCLM